MGIPNLRYPALLPITILSPPSPLSRSPDGRLLCSGDDFGRVRLFHYPVVVEHAPSVAATGHSSHVMNVRFSGDGKRVWSVGGHDSAVFQWRLVTGQAAAAQPVKVRHALFRKIENRRSAGCASLKGPVGGPNPTNLNVLRLTKSLMVDVVCRRACRPRRLAEATGPPSRQPSAAHEGRRAPAGHSTRQQTAGRARVVAGARSRMPRGHRGQVQPLLCQTTGRLLCRRTGGGQLPHGRRTWLCPAAVQVRRNGGKGRGRGGRAQVRPGGGKGRRGAGEGGGCRRLCTCLDGWAAWRAWRRPGTCRRETASTPPHGRGERKKRGEGGREVCVLHRSRQATAQREQKAGAKDKEPKHHVDERVV